MTRRVQTARQNGSLGGKQGSRNLTEEQREERARNAGNALLTLYGQDYFSFLGKSNRTKTHKKSVVEIPTKISTAARRLNLALG
jgi:ribosomal protein L29